MIWSLWRSWSGDSCRDRDINVEPGLGTVGCGREKKPAGDEQRVPGWRNITGIGSSDAGIMTIIRGQLGSSLQSRPASTWPGYQEYHVTRECHELWDTGQGIQSRPIDVIVWIIQSEPLQPASVSGAVDTISAGRHGGVSGVNNKCIFRHWETRL